VVVGGREMAETSLKKSPENSRNRESSSARLIMEGGLSAFLRPFLAWLRQSMS